MEDNRYGYESQDSVQVDMTGPASGNEYEELNTETASGNEYKDQNTAEAQGNENETRNAAADERRSSASYQNAGSSYQSAYQSAYQGDYRSGAGNQSDYRNGAGYEKDAFSTEKKHKKSGRTGKAILAVLLAAVFGICAGAGAYGVSRAIGANTNGTSKAQAQLQIAEEPEEKEAREEVQQAPEEDASAVQSAREEASGTQEAAAAQGSEDAQASENSGDKDAAKARLQSRSEDVQLNTGEKYVVVTDVTEMVEKTMPSIVSVYNNYTLQYHDWFGQSYSQESTATGSGIIIAATDDELLVVTNNHVIDGEESLEVQFINETTAEAQIKGTDPDNDLAVIAVSMDDLDAETLDAITVATLANSDNLKIGEPVIAIGNALGFGQSVTQGIVSALDREIGTSEENALTYIQTDAAINPGNSGGALVDINGHVVGINSNKIGDTKVEGMCYAIPTARAIPIIEELMTQSTKIKVDEEKQGYLGIRGASVTSQVASAYDMPRGVYVAELIEGSGAAASDLQKGDIITGINKAAVTDMEGLQKQLQYYEAGEEVILTVQRSTGNAEFEEMEISVTLTGRDVIESDDSQQGGSANGRSGQSFDNGSQESPSQEYDGSGMNEFPWSRFFGY